jgi:PAS domain-containing protein
MLTTVSLALAGTSAGVWALWRGFGRTARARSKGVEEAHSQFLAAAETSLDAFGLLEAVRNGAGEIIDFRILYANANGERLVGRPRSELVGQMLCSVTPARPTSSMFVRFCKVVESGEPLNEEFSVNLPNIKASWLRSQVVKLGDGLAVTFSDISEAKAAQERYMLLAEFTDSVFQNAPFSIVATDKNGLITAMNVAAEKLTGYNREELVGKAPLTALHDERELLGKALSINPTATTLGQFGFLVLTAGVTAGEMEEQEWTLVGRDGMRTPINLAMRAVTTDTGEVSGYVSIAVDITERKQMLEYVTRGARSLTGQDGTGGGPRTALWHEGRGICDRPGSLQAA